LVLVEELVNGNIIIEVKRQRPFSVEENLTLEKVLINVDAHINDLLVDIDENDIIPIRCFNYFYHNKHKIINIYIYYMDSKIIIDLLEKKDFKKDLVKKLNGDVDIPFINEKTERKVIEKIYDVFIKALKEKLDD